MGRSIDEDDKEAVLTLAEYLEREAALEREALSVLPGKFDRCSYGEGYTRQNVFVCTHCTQGTAAAVICYACSIACHSQCELVDLGVRRAVRCDCGNSLFVRTV